MEKVTYPLNALEVHHTLFASGFVNLVAIRNACHWTRDNQLIIVHHELPVSETPVHENTVTNVLFANFVKLASGEMVLA